MWKKLSNVQTNLLKVFFLATQFSLILQLLFSILTRSGWHVKHMTAGVRKSKRTIRNLRKYKTSYCAACSSTHKSLVSSSAASWFPTQLSLLCRNSNRCHDKRLLRFISISVLKMWHCFRCPQKPNTPPYWYQTKKTTSSRHTNTYTR